MILSLRPMLTSATCQSLPCVFSPSRRIGRVHFPSPHLFPSFSQGLHLELGGFIKTLFRVVDEDDVPASTREITCLLRLPSLAGCDTKQAFRKGY